MNRIISSIIVLVLGIGFSNFNAIAKTGCFSSCLSSATATYYQKLVNCLAGPSYAACVSACKRPCGCMLNNCASQQPLAAQYNECLAYTCSCNMSCVANQGCFQYDPKNSQTQAQFYTCMSGCGCNTSCLDQNCLYNCYGKCGCDVSCLQTNSFCIAQKSNPDAYKSCLSGCKCNTTCTAQTCLNLSDFYNQYVSCALNCQSYSACINDCNTKITLTGITPTLVTQCRNDLSNPNPLKVCAGKGFTDCNTPQACQCLCMPEESALIGPFLVTHLPLCNSSCESQYKGNATAISNCQSQCKQLFLSNPLAQCNAQGYTNCVYTKSCPTSTE